MKKLILLLFTLSIYQIGFSQVDVKIEKNITLDAIDENYTPYEYISNGVYKINLCSDYDEKNNDKSSAYKRIPLGTSLAKTELNKFVSRNNYSFEIIADEFRYLDDGCSYSWNLIFKLKDSSGNLIITKKEAKKKLIDLKELLDLGLITQTEYDNKAQGLKKVLLN